MNPSCIFPLHLGQGISLRAMTELPKALRCRYVAAVYNAPAGHAVSGETDERCAPYRFGIGTANSVTP